MSEPAANPNPGACTCHPDDRPPYCPKCHALSECRAALVHEALESAAGLLSRLSSADQERFRSQINRIKAIDEWNRLGNIVEPR